MYCIGFKFTHMLCIVSSHACRYASAFSSSALFQMLLYMSRSWGDLPLHCRPCAQYRSRFETKCWQVTEWLPFSSTFLQIQTPCTFKPLFFLPYFTSFEVYVARVINDYVLSSSLEQHFPLEVFVMRTFFFKVFKGSCSKPLLLLEGPRSDVYEKIFFSLYWFALFVHLLCYGECFFFLFDQTDYRVPSFLFFFFWNGGIRFLQLRFRPIFFKLFFFQTRFTALKATSFLGDI